MAWAWSHDQHSRWHLGRTYRRVGFNDGTEVWTKDILNIGVSPVKLIAAARSTFEKNGGTVLERTRVSGESGRWGECRGDEVSEAMAHVACVRCLSRAMHPPCMCWTLSPARFSLRSVERLGHIAGAEVRADGIQIDASGERVQSGGVTAELLIDCMGHGSPIVRQYR